MEKSYEFFRNKNLLNARGFFDSQKTGLSAESISDATLGGPIKKDKTFFFARLLSMAGDYRHSPRGRFRTVIRARVGDPEAYRRISRPTKL